MPKKTIPPRQGPITLPPALTPVAGLPGPKGARGLDPAALRGPRGARRGADVKRLPLPGKSRGR
jgi:hypothetical protein